MSRKSKILRRRLAICNLLLALAIGSVLAGSLVLVLYAKQFAAYSYSSF